MLDTIREGTGPTMTAGCKHGSSGSTRALLAYESLMRFKVGSEPPGKELLQSPAFGETRIDYRPRR